MRKARKLNSPRGSRLPFTIIKGGLFCADKPVVSFGQVQALREGGEDVEHDRLAEIESRAEAVLHEHAFGRVPVPIISICRAMGIDVFYSDFRRPNVSGAIVGKSGKFTIYVRRSEPEPRQRFTVAHELGHYILHLADKAADLGYTDELPEKRYVAAFRSAHLGSEEEEANAFAAAILMPAKAIQSRASWAVDEDYDDGARDLARQFHVSYAAMTRRLAELELAAAYGT